MKSSVPPRASSNRSQSLARWNNGFALLALLTFALGASAVASRSPRPSVSTSARHRANPHNSFPQGLKGQAPNSVVPGDLDLSFGVDGTVTVDLGNNLEDSANAVAVQPDGKVVAVGYVSTSSTGRDFAVIRLNTNGSLDTTFSDDGKLSFNFGSATRDDIARAVAVQPDGRIVVAGEADVLGFGNFDIVVARLNADGAFDTSFGSNGKVVTNLPNNRPDFGRGLALQSDGKLLVAGYSNRPTTGDDFVVVRYGLNGSLDTTFNGTGIVTTDILTNREDRAAAIAVQPDGNIVVTGYTNDPSFKNDFAIARYSPNGSLDSSLNGTGKVHTDLNLNSDDVGNAVTLQSDGKILIAGDSSSDFGLARYNQNGSMDLSFGGGDGIVTTNFGTNAADSGRAVTVQPGGKIIVAGRSRTELAAARYTADGTLDTTFDGDGLLVQNAGNNQLSPFGGYRGMTIQLDGKIVAVGDGWRDFSANDFVVSRLSSNGAFDFTFGGGDGITSTDFFGRYDEATDVVIQADGKIVVTGRTVDSAGAYKVSLARYNTNGTLDPSFDGDGLVVTDLPQYDFEDAQAIAMQIDGKFLVAGSAMNPSTLLNDGFLIRYNSNGTLDSSFGPGGIVITPGNLVGEGNVWLYPRDIALQPDGRIVVAGLARYISVYGDGYVARYNPNGSLDSSFLTNIPNHSPNGSVVVNFGNNYNYLNAVTLQTDGKIVIVGWTNEGSPDLALARLNPNGSLDTSFDGDGKVTTDFGNNRSDSGADVQIQPDGKIIAVGQTEINFIDMAVARYNTNGSLDTTFGGGDGKLNLDFATWADVCTGIALQPDGKIILAGTADLSRNFTGVAIVRLTSTGAFDTSFGNGTGRLVTTLGEGVNTGLGQVINGVGLQSDGKIVAVGTSNFNSTDRDFVVVRYEADLTCTYVLDPSAVSFSALGGNGSFGVSTAGACSWSAMSNANWITTTSNSSGNGTVNFAVAANSGVARSGTISVGGQAFTINQDAPTSHGSKKTGVFRPSTGELFLKNANSSGFADTYIIFGNPGDYPVAGDWNGDGIDSVGIYRNGVFYLRNTNTTGFADIVVPFGNPSDQPVVGDWNGDGVDTIGVYRNGTFILRNSNTAGSPDLVFTLGNPGDVGIAGDWNGDGVTTCGVFRPSNGIVYLKNTNTTGFADLSFVFGNAGDKPVAGDWNGDGIDTIGIYRNGVFYLTNSNTTGFADIVFVLGNSGDFPIAGNWNGQP